MNREKISIVVPVLNEAENIPYLLEKISKNCNFYECIFVDDGSSDGTVDAIKKVAQNDSRIFFISFSRNFGHQIALKAGFDYASGDCVITLDGDMQHPPHIIPRMVQCWREGADVVHTRRDDKQSISLFKKHSSTLFYSILNKVSPVKIEHNTADFRLIDSSVLEICKHLEDDTFFWRGIIPWMGYKQVYVDYFPEMRLHGVSKYSLKKMIRLAWDGISSLSVMPLRFASLVGCTTLLVSILYAFYIFIEFILGKTVSGWASIMISILFFSSLQMLFLGILGEYIGKIFVSSRRRPTYIIKDKSI